MAQVSILLPIYNAEKYLTEALQGIQMQSMSDFHLIALLDGCTDNSETILRDMMDDRTTILRRKQNQGLIAALNTMLEHCSTEFAARFDADDVMHPSRLEAQLEFLQKNPDIDVVGTNFDYIDENSRSSGGVQFPTDHDAIVEGFKTYTALGHPTVMFRTDKVKEAGGYDTDFRHAEDIEMWLRILATTDMRFANIPAPLNLYRMHPSQVSTEHAETQKASKDRAYFKWGPKLWPDMFKEQPVKEPMKLKKKKPLKLKKRETES